MKSNGVEGVDRELLAISYENLKPMVGMNVVASGGVSTILWLGGANWPLIWFAAVAILSAGRFILGARLTRDVILNGTPGQSARWRRHFAIGLYASAASWTALSLFVSRSHGADQFMVAIILSALAAGGTGILAAMLREGRVYITAMLGPVSLLLFNHDRQGLIMTFLGLVFGVVMIVVHNRNHLAIRRGIELKIENLDLVSDLKALNRDLEQRIEERTEALVNAANSDSLTGLPNRRRLLSWMHAHLHPDDGREAAVLFLDLDRFKQINDAMGHDVGDRILQAVVGRLNPLVPEGALLALGRGRVRSGAGAWRGRSPPGGADRKWTDRSGQSAFRDRGTEYIARAVRRSCDVSNRCNHARSAHSRGRSRCRGG